MLKSLFIRNYVLIDELDIRFEDGFSVITGETGAGKSIILGALSLVLGERVESGSIQSGKDKCVIEAVFDISTYRLEKFFRENDLDYDTETCMFRRELYGSGKSRAFVNDSPVSLSVVKELGNMLIDVHSQHQNLMLADTHFQLNVVDLMAHTGKQLAAYRNEYNNYLSLCEKLAELKNRASNMKQEEDYIRFQYEELNAAKLQVGEQEELEKESDTLSHTEEIKTALYKITELLNGEGKSVVSSLKEALNAVEQLSAYFPKAGEYAGRLRTSYIDMNDLASETDVLKDDVEFDPERLDWVNNRLNTVYSLQQKHKVSSVEELVAKRDGYGVQLNAIESFDEELDTLTERRQASYELLMKQAAEITGLRENASETIEKQIVERMTLLGMPNARFRILFTPKSKPTADGTDEVSFLFSANKNEQLKPVAQTASGGEISRLMLCVKAMIAGYAALPSIIFDEIDIGVSGEIADKMADIMQDLGGKMQVMTITHLPQIAAKGKAHYFVYKEDTPERTYTRIRRLNDSERVEEIARMLSGTRMTQAAIDNAKVLLEL
ncbi:MAG: DNA repair protein RecN [Tannerella sp.]|jgi:DNA repair protein RecN (Recombination protein N)|nr:DNA repair protein RecN [Tannerella sp.]